MSSMSSKVLTLIASGPRNTRIEVDLWQIKTRLAARQMRDEANFVSPRLGKVDPFLASSRLGKVDPFSPRLVSRKSTLFSSRLVSRNACSPRLVSRFCETRNSRDVAVQRQSIPPEYTSIHGKVVAKQKQLASVATAFLFAKLLFHLAFQMKFI